MLKSQGASKRTASVHQIARVLGATCRQSAMLAVGLAVAVTLSVALGLVPPLVLQRLVDYLVGGGTEPSRAAALALAYVAIAVAGSLATFAREASITAFGERFTHAMRTHMTNKLGRLPAAYFSTHGAGQIASLFVGDVVTLETLFSSGIVSLVADVCSLVGIVAIVLVRCPGLGILLLVALPAVFAYTRHVQLCTREAQAARRRAVADANQAVPETLRCLRVVRLLGRQSHMRERYDAIVERGFAAMERSNFYDSIYSPVVITTGALVTGIALWMATLGGVWAELFGMTAGTAVAMIAYVSQVFTPISDIGMEIQTIQSAGAGLDRIRGFLSQEELPHVAELNAPQVTTPVADLPSADRPAVAVGGVSFAYRADEPILRDVSMTVRQGEVVTLEGRTGSGKSTLFSLLLGLYAPDAGMVRILGQDPRAIPAADRRQVFGYVPQSFLALHGSIADNVTLRDGDIAPQQVAAALELAGLGPAVAALPQGAQTPLDQAGFSQGQLQLLSIARAVVCDPKVLLLDETNANLDSATEKSVMDALLAASRGRTVVSISHRTSGFLGGRRVRLEDGRLVPME